MGERAFARRGGETRPAAGVVPVAGPLSAPAVTMRARVGGVHGARCG